MGGQPNDALELGAFALVEPIRRGGMAEVWRGVHRASRAPVAVKLVTAERARTPHLREALRNEVRAMARLDHPGIVRVHDYGEVSHAVADASEGLLEPSVPYLVMELVPDGTLDASHAGSWDDLRDVLSQLLRALAHAHARGVVHRDLKPSNVLFSHERRRFRLSDFGIANALARRPDDASRDPMSAGTAAFMAPEQILALHADEGPWTDLYALGCLAYVLATGRAPYCSDEPEEVYRAHCLASAPPLAPRFDVPRELETWIAVLLAKRPRARFRFAADALAALEALGGRRLAAVPRDARPAREPARDGSETTTGSIAAPEESARAAIVAATDAIEADAIRMRASSRRRLTEPPPSEPARETARELLGIGLGVYGLRTIPITGRETERVRLWDALRDVARRGVPRVVELRGRSGHGKTRLAEWLTERATESGAAIVLWGAIGAPRGSGDVVARTILRAIHDGLATRAELEERLASHPTEPSLDSLEPGDRARVLDLIAPSLATREPVRPAERHAIAARFLSALGEARPIVLVLDDAHLGRDALGLAEHLLKVKGARLPVLVVMTTSEEALDDRPAESAMLEELLRRPRAERIDLGPLDAEDHARLVGAMLGLEDALARRVAERTSGNPLFAIQLVGDWVQRGELVVGRRGFRLRDGSSPALPDSIHDLWAARIARLLDARPPSERERASAVLELAALLGRDVSVDELAAVCAEAQVEIPADLLDALAARRLAIVGESRFSFVHGALVESLQRRATEAGRAPALHRACARSLSPRDGVASDAPAERIGRHLAAAGDSIEAAPLLLAGARARLQRCEYEDVIALCAELDDGLARAGVSPRDRLRASSYVTRAEATVLQARLDEGQAWLARASEVEGDAPDVHARVCVMRARIALKQARNQRATELFRDALARTTEIDDLQGIAHSLHGLGESAKLLGRFEEAIGWYERGIELLEDAGDHAHATSIRIGLADVYRRLGRLEEALPILEKGVEALRSSGAIYSMAVAVNALGDVARGRGDLESAERHYAEGLAALDGLASDEATIVRLNVALVQLARGRWDVARASFERGGADLEGEGRAGYLAFAVAGLWACDVAEHAWDDARERGARLGALLAEHAIVDDDLARTFDEVARLATLAGHEDEAAIARERAEAQWRALGRGPDARR